MPFDESCGVPEVDSVVVHRSVAVLAIAPMNQAPKRNHKSQNTIRRKPRPGQVVPFSQAPKRNPL